MKKIVITFSLLLVAVAAHAAGFDRSSWRFVAPVSVTTSSPDGLVSLYLKRPVLAFAGMDPNIRIIDASGREVPYTTAPFTVRQVSSLSLYDISARGEEKQFIADSEGAMLAHSSIDIEVIGNNYKRQVSVFAADERLPLSSSGWRLLTDQGYIYDYTDPKAGLHVRAGKVSYPVSGSRYLKVVVAPGEGHIESVLAASAEASNIERADEEEIFSTAVAAESGEGNTTILNIDLGMLEIVRRVSLDATDSNFDRRVAVEYQDRDGTWRSVSAAHFFGVKSGTLVRKELHVNLPDVAATALRLTVVNLDDRPLTFMPTATVMSPEVRVLFRAEPGTYTLYVGSDIPKPRYDIQKTVAESRDHSVAVVGALGDNPLFKPAALPEPPFTEKYAFIFNIALVVLVLFLGVFLALYIRKLSKENNTV